MKKIKPLLITAAIAIAFLCGMQFEKSQKNQTIKQADPPRVFIEQLKTKMNISKNKNEIEIFLNGEKMTEDIKLDLKR